MAYILKLGNYYLAPRKDVIVEEGDGFEDYGDEDNKECAASSTGGTCAAPATVQKVKFKVYSMGNCSLRNAYDAKSLIDIEIARACANEFVVLRRRVHDEHEQDYEIGGGFTRIVEYKNQYVRERVLTLNVELNIKNFTYGDPPANPRALSHLPLLDITCFCP